MTTEIFSYNQSAKDLRLDIDNEHSNSSAGSTLGSTSFVPYLINILWSSFRYTLLREILRPSNYINFNTSVRSSQKVYNSENWSSIGFQPHCLNQNRFNSLLEGVRHIFRTVTFTSCAASTTVEVCDFPCKMYQSEENLQPINQIGNFLQMHLDTKDKQQPSVQLISSQLIIKEIPALIISASSASAELAQRECNPCTKSEAFVIKISCTPPKTTESRLSPKMIPVLPFQSVHSLPVNENNLTQKAEVSKKNPPAFTKNNSYKMNSSVDETLKVNQLNKATGVEKDETDGCFSHSRRLPKMEPKKHIDESADDDDDSDSSDEYVCRLNSLPTKPRQRNISECSDDSFICFLDTNENNKLTIEIESDSDDSENTSGSCLDSEDESDDDDFAIDFGEHTKILSNRKVRFNLKPEIHVMRTWDYAYRSARKGFWEQCARDRSRFQQRIQRAADLLNPVLNENHRSTIYKTRFADPTKEQ